MKFCPNCGFPLEGKLKCSCGYDVETGEVDKKIYEDYKEKEKSLYEQSCDNMSNMMGKVLLDEEALKQIPQPIFNKDNDNIYRDELAELITYMKSNKDK